MEFLSQDREIGPELVTLLTSKLKKTKEALHSSETENRRLQTQLNEIQTHGVTGSIQPKVERDDAAGIGYTCREGICPATDQVKSLNDIVRDLETRLETREQEYQTEVSQLQESLNRVKTKYKECKAKLKESKREINADSVSQGPPEETVDTTQVDLHTSVSERPSLEQQWIQSAAKPCLSRTMTSPFELPNAIRRLIKFGTIFMPECTDFDPAQDQATIYLPYKMCRPNDRLIWYHNAELDYYASGRTKELFYRNNEDVCYAGQFECVEESVLTPEIFEAFEPARRDFLIQWTLAIPATAVLNKTWNIISRKYLVGEAKIMSFHLRRVGFNDMLYNAMKDLRELSIPIALPTNNQPTAGQKRRGNNLDATSDPKKAKRVDRRRRD